MKLSAKSAEISGLENLINSLSERKNEIEAGQRDIVFHENFLKRYEEKNAILSATEAEIKTLQKKAELLESSVRQQEKQISAVSENLERITLKLNEQTASRNVLTRLAHSYEGYGGAVRFIMQRKELSGIFGTVGELITVPAGYETAVETVLGARMQNIVCRDDSSADQAIRLLKKYRAGRLTFLPLDSLRLQHKNLSTGLLKEDGFLAAASDCVQIAPQYRKITEYLLSGVIIIDTLENAVKISKKYKNYRYVTLEGELVNPAGAITGGAYRKNTEGGILERKKRLRQIEDDIQSSSSQKIECESRLTELKTELYRKSEELSELKRRISTLKIEQISARNEAAAAKSRIDEAKNKEHRSQQECERIEAERKNACAQTARLREEKIAAARLTEELKKSIELLIAQNEERRKSLENLGAEITGIKLTAEALRGELSGTETLIQRADASLAELRTDISEKESSVKHLIQEMKEAEEKAERISVLIKNMEQSDKSKEGRLERILREKEENSGSVSEKTALREEKGADSFRHQDDVP